MYVVPAGSRLLRAFRSHIAILRGKTSLPRIETCQQLLDRFLAQIGLYKNRRGCSLFALLALRMVVTAALPGNSCAQTPSTCALTGVTLDSSGALLPGAALTLANQSTGQTRNTGSDEEGRFGFLLLIPGCYELCARKADFETQRLFQRVLLYDSSVIGADGIGTKFGDSATGIVEGPGQANLDLLLSTTMTFDWPREKSSLTFRAEFYNAFNHPQFANPDSNFTSSTFGVISAMAVSPRVIQLALKFAF